MRILGVKKKWDKLKEPSFTTFRFARKDKDWQMDEIVQVVYKPRSKEREILGPAKIKDKSPRIFDSSRTFSHYLITNPEVQADGFSSYQEMMDWFYKQYGERIFREPINKLTLKWNGGKNG
jgi:hypothetical protein